MMIVIMIMIIILIVIILVIILIVSMIIMRVTIIITRITIGQTLQIPPRLESLVQVPPHFLFPLIAPK